MSDMKTRIETAIKKRDELNAQKERMLGRLEEAEKNLESLRTECRSKSVDPDSLDATVSKLEKGLEDSLTALESQISVAENAIKPYTQS